jgi:hypothetical protein
MVLDPLNCHHRSILIFCRLRRSVAFRDHWLARYRFRNNRSMSPRTNHGRADAFSEPNQSKAKGSCDPPLFGTTAHLVQFQTARKQLFLDHHHCEPTGRANERPMTGSANQSILRTVSKLDCFASLAMT